MACINFNNVEVRNDFNEILTILNGTVLSDNDIIRYKSGLNNLEKQKYYAAYAIFLNNITDINEAKKIATSLEPITENAIEETHIYTPDEIDHIYKTLSSMMIKIMNDNKTTDTLDEQKLLKKKDGSVYTSIPDMLYQVLISTRNLKVANKSLILNGVQFNNITNIANDIINNNNPLYKNWIKYFNVNFHTNINSSEETEIYFDTDGIPQDFDGKRLLTVNHIDRVNAKIKALLSRVIDNKTINEFTGFPEVVDINIVWSKLIDIHQFDFTIYDMIKTLNKFGEINNIYNKIAEKLNDSSISSENLQDIQNAYIQSIKKSKATDKILALSRYGIDTASVMVANRGSFIEFLVYDKLYNNINNKLSRDYFNDIIKDIIDSFTEKDITKLNKSEKDTLINSYANALFHLGYNIDNNILNTIILNNDVTKFRQLERYVLGTDNKKGIYKLINSAINDDKEISITSFTNYLKELTILLKDGLLDMPELSYSNVNRENQYTAQDYNFLTYLFREYKDDNDVKKAFEIFTQQHNSIYYNWLWNTTQDIKGIFDPEVDGNDIPIIYYFDKNNNEVKESEPYFRKGYKISKVNLKFLNNFSAGLFGGNKIINDNEGEQYTEIKGDNWTYTNVVSFISALREINGEVINPNTVTNPIERYMGLVASSDSGRTFQMMVPIIENNGIEFDENNNFSKLTENSELYNNIRNTVLSELSEMFTYINNIFDIEKSTLKLKEEFKNNPNKLKQLHKVKFTGFKNGIPKGTVFNPSNLTFIKDGKVTKLLDYIQSKYKSDKLYAHSLDSFLNKYNDDINEFINTALTYRINKFLNYSNKIIKNLYDDNKERSIKIKNNSFGDTGDIKAFNNTEEVTKSLIHFYLNDYIFRVEYGNMVNGSTSEYSDVLKRNKRDNQAIKVSTRFYGDDSFTALTLKEILKDNLIPILNDLPKSITDSLLTEDGKVKSTDGISLITLEEHIRRIKKRGLWEEYKDTLNKFQNEDFIPTHKELKNFIESQKYFYYNREMQGSIIPELTSTQIKNSAIVLYPSLIKNNKLGAIANAMKVLNIDQVNFEGTLKVGKANASTVEELLELVKTPPVEERDMMEKFAEYKANYVNSHKYIGLGVQQDIPSHNVDSFNKLAIQLTKLLMVNINLDNKIYDYNNKKLSGKELWNEYNDIIALKIERSMQHLLSKLGGVYDKYDEVKNDDGEIIAMHNIGDIKYDSYGNILVNNNKVIDIIKNYVDNENVNSNIESSLLTINDDIALPYYATINFKKFQQVILSKFTKDIVEQKLSGIAVPIIPDSLFEPIIPLEDFFKTTNSSFTSEFINKCLKNNKFELGVTTFDNEKNSQLCEVILNPFYSKFFNTSEKIDMDSIQPELLESLGIRIPTDGKQSVIYFKVVGFMNTGASQAIFPASYIKQTGWDFDIDKVFAYFRRLSINKRYTPNSTEENKRYKYVVLHNDNSNLKYIAYIKEQLKHTDYHKDLLNILSDSNESLISISDNLDNIYAERNNIKDNIEFNKSELKEIQTDLGNILFKSKQSFKKLSKDFKLQYHNITNNNTDNDKLDFITANIEYLELTIKNKQKYPNLLLFDDMIKQYNEILNIAGIKSEFIETLNTLFEQNKNYKDLYFKIYTDLASNYHLLTQEQYNALPELQKLTEGELDNRLIDVFKSVMTNKEHQIESQKSNDTDNIQAVMSDINARMGYDISLFSHTDFTDYGKIRELNLNSRELKAISVSQDALRNILSFINAKYDILNSPVYLFHESEITANLETINSIIGKATISNKGKGWYKVYDNNIGKNKQGGWTDITGSISNLQLSEITSNILDSVSKPMLFNFTNTLIGVFEVLCSGSMIFDYKFEDGTIKPNKYYYPTLFIAQPVLTEFKENIESGIGENYSSFNIYSKLYYKTLSEYYKFLNKSDDKFLEKIETAIEKVYGNKNKDITEATIVEDNIDTNENSVKVNLDKTQVIKFKNLLKSVIDDKRDNVFLTEDSIEEHNKLLYIINRHIDLANIGTLSDLNHSIDVFGKNIDKDKLYYATQLDTLSKFWKYEKLANRLTSLATVLNSDKSSIGPTFANTRKFMTNLSYHIIKPNDLFNRLINFKVNGEKIFNSNEANEIRNNYILATTPDAKIRILDGIDINLAMMGSKKSIKSKSLINVNGIDVIISVFPKLFYGNYSTLNSVYPMLENYTVNGMALIKPIFNEQVIFETDSIVEFKNKFYSTTNIPDITTIDDKINSSILSLLISDMPFMQKFVSENIKRILGQNVKDTSNLVSPDNKIVPFSELSLAQKLREVLNDKKYIKLFKDSKFANVHFINNLNINDVTSKSFKVNKRNDRGYDLIHYSDKSGNINMEIFSFLNTFNSNDEKLRSIALDFIAYTLIVNKLQFGNNISKIIPSELFYNTENQILTGTLSDYSEHIKSKHKLLLTKDILNFSQNNIDFNKWNDILHRQFWNNPNINPKFYKRGFINAILKTHKFEENGEVKNMNYIIENVSAINNSNLANAEYVTFKESYSNILLLKRYKINYNLTDYYVYYPIEKYLPGQTNDGIINKYNELSFIEVDKQIKFLSANNQLFSDDIISDNKRLIETNYEQLLKGISFVNKQLWLELRDINIPSSDSLNEDEESIIIDYKKLLGELYKKLDIVADKLQDYLIDYSDKDSVLLEVPIKPIDENNKLRDLSGISDANYILGFSLYDNKQFNIKYGADIFTYNSNTDAFESNNNIIINENDSKILALLNVMFPESKVSDIFSYIKVHLEALKNPIFKNRTLVGTINVEAGKYISKDDENIKKLIIGLNSLNLLDNGNPIVFKDSGIVFVEQDSSNTDVIKSLNNISNVQLYIGNDNGMYYNLVKNNTSKLLTTNFENIDIVVKKILDNLQHNNDTISIFGDNSRKTGFTNNYVDALLKRLKHFTNDKITILTHYHNNIGKSVANMTDNTIAVKNTNTILNNSKFKDSGVPFTQAQQLLSDKASILFDMNDRALKESMENINRLGATFRHKGEINELVTRTFAILSEMKNTDIYNNIVGNDLSNRIIALQYSIGIADEIKLHLALEWDSIKDIDLDLLFEDSSASERARFHSKLLMSSSVVNSMKYVNDLKPIPLTPELEDFKESVEEFNTNLVSLQHTYSNMMKAYNNIYVKRTEFLYKQIENYSHNPRYITKFNNLKNKLHSTESTENFIQFITNDILGMYHDNEDISFSMQYLDSPFATGSTLIDTIMSDYFVLQDEYIKKANVFTDDLKKLIDNHSPIKVKHNVFNKERAIWFSKFLDEDNYIIQDYNYSNFYNKLSEINKQFNEIISEINSLPNTRVDDIDALRKKANSIYFTFLSENCEGISLDKLGDIVVDYTLSDDIALSDEEQTDILNRKNIFGNYTKFNIWCRNNNIIRFEGFRYGSVSNTYIKLKLKDSLYKDDRYSKLSDTDKLFINDYSKLLSDISVNNIPYYSTGKGFYPIVSLEGIKSTVLELIGAKNPTPKENYTFIGISDREIYHKDCPFLQNVEFEFEYNQPNQNKGETNEEYEIRAVKHFNDYINKIPVTRRSTFRKMFASGKIETLKDIQNYNKAIRDSNRKRTRETICKDPFLTAKAFIDATTQFKLRNDFYDVHLNLLQSIEHDMEFGVYNGVVDTIKSAMSKSTKIQTKRNRDSRTFQQQSTFGKNLIDTPLVNNNWDKALNMIYRYTSTAYMGLGWINGIKNITSGYSQMLIRTGAGDFTTFEHLFDATLKYRKAVIPLLASTKTEYCDNLEGALMKRFSNIFNDTGEKVNSSNFTSMAGMARWMYDAMYFQNTAGEHFMQYVTFLALCKSTKIVDGRIISRYDYLSGILKNTIEKYLTPEQIGSLNEYIKIKEKSKSKENNQDVYISDWISDNFKALKPVMSEMLKDYRTTRKQAKLDFEKLPSVESQFELSGEKGMQRATLKKDSTLTDTELSHFSQRVQTINQSMQGVYDKINRNVFRQNMIGTVTMQFKNWMRPNWNRAWGQKMFGTTFNEALGTYNKGYFTSSLGFIFKPLIKSKIKNRDEGVTIIKAMTNLLGDMFTYYSNMRANYSLLNEMDKANVKQTYHNMAGIISIISLYYIIMGLAGDDDDEKNKAIADSKALSLMLYEVYSTAGEVGAMMPQNLLTTINRMKQNTSSTESMLVDMFDLLGTGINSMMPWTDEQDNYYSRGIYKGYSKFNVKFEKIVPVARQFNKFEFINSYMNWYKQYSIFGM